MDELMNQLTQRLQAWTLYHWAGLAFGLGLAAVMGKALWEELRDNKSMVSRFFIVCATIAALLLAAAMLGEVIRSNGWQIF